VSLIKHALEKRDYSGGIFSNPLGLEPGQIPTNGQLAYLDGSGGYPITTNAAMRHWAVWACVRIIADVVSTLPIDVYTKVDGKIVPVEPTPTRLLIPSAYATKLQWTWQVMASDLLRGNAYGLYADFDRLGYPTQVDIISPDAVTDVCKDERGRKVFKIAGQTLGTDQVWHLPGPQMPGELAGMSPITYASRTIGLGLNAEKFGSDFFQSGINPTAVLESDQQINGDQAKEIKDRVIKATQDRSIAVMGAGLKLSPWQMSAHDAQFLETSQLNATAIAQIFGVPPEMIGAGTGGSTVTYANREQRAQDFLNSAVNPWISRLEEALSAWFPRGTYVKYNTGALLRSDLITRYESYDIGIHSNVLLPSEARAFEDLPVIPGIDDKPLPSPAPKSQGSTDAPNKG
jgi:HK97 family phage portal protein